MTIEEQPNDESMNRALIKFKSAMGEMIGKWMDELKEHDMEKLMLLMNQLSAESHVMEITVSWPFVRIDFFISANTPDPERETVHLFSVEERIEGIKHH